MPYNFRDIRARIFARSSLRDCDQQQNVSSGSGKRRSTTRTVAVEKIELRNVCKTDAIHQLPIERLYNIFEMSPKSGLNDAQVKSNKKKFGSNTFTPPKQPSRGLQYFKCLFGPFEFLLWAAAVICFVLYGIQMASSISSADENLHMGFLFILIVMLVGTLRFYQETRMQNTIRSFCKLLPQYATVVRNGRKTVINISDVVVGDIVVIRMSDKIPADTRIIESYRLKIDTSALTGESRPVAKIPLATDSNPLESKNMVFFSTHAVEGYGKGLVLSVGDQTVMGKIVEMTSDLVEKETPFSKDMSNMATVLCIIAFSFGVLSIILSAIVKISWIDALIFFIAVLIANVPFGVACFIPMCLVISARRMAKRNCIVKNLEAVETLGSTTVLCTDKTGTLTQNTMTVSHIWFNDELVGETGEVKLRPDFHLGTAYTPGFRALANVAVLCNNARVLNGADDVSLSMNLEDQTFDGDTTDRCILRYMESHRINYKAIRNKYCKRLEIPFNSQNKYHLTLLEEIEFGQDGFKRSTGKFLLVMKGAPERVLQLCNRVLIDDREYDLDSGWMLKIEEIYESLCQLGERVLGFCDLHFSSSDFPGDVTVDETLGFLNYGLRFVGLISMYDPPRPCARDTVAKCREAGIKVIMMTGDHPISAKAIARNVGIISEGEETVEEMADRLGVSVRDVNPNLITATVINGTQLKYISLQTLNDILRNHEEIVFSRMLPDQKLQIVQVLQNAGEIVAVTGDGVNDAPALRKANIGIAMGRGGTEVAKDCSDLILMDDQFSSVILGVEEGRNMFDNLKKCCFFGLTDSPSCVLTFIIYIVLKIPTPLENIAMIFIALLIDFLPAVSFAFEPADRDFLMKRKPRDAKKDRLINQRLISACYGQIGMIEACAGFFSYIVVLYLNGFQPSQLVGLQKRWNSPAINDLQDSFGQEWTYSQRQTLTRMTSTAFFVAVVICQIANLLYLKTRQHSIFSPRIFKNHVLNLAIVCNLLIASALIYIPGMDAIEMHPLRWEYWLPAFPFFVLILVWGEVSRVISVCLQKFGCEWCYNEFKF